MSEQPQQPQQPQAPVFSIEKIYVKDLSLEVPNAPQVFSERENPKVDINIHNEARALEPAGYYEVTLTATVTAKAQEKTYFLVEAAQSGVFQIRNLPPQDLDAVLGILCPNTLMPYARETVSSTLMRAGFPPVMLQHMNFEAVYQQRLQQMQAQQAAAGAAVPPAPPVAH